jgi:hypothetical protein
VLCLGETNCQQQAAWRKSLEVFADSEEDYRAMSLFRETRETSRFRWTRPRRKPPNNATTAICCANLAGEDPAVLWTRYVQLTQIGFQAYSAKSP